MADYITKAEAKRKATSRRAIHAIMLRNQYHIPRYNDRLCTRDWMYSVREGKYWVPKTREVKLRNCVSTPSKEIIWEALQLCLE